MRKIRESLQRAWDALDDKKQMEKWRAEREAEQEAEKQAEHQRYVESRRVLAPLAGRLILVTQFQGRKDYGERLAEQIDGLSVLPSRFLGISTHVGDERSQAGPKGYDALYGANPFLSSAEALVTSFNGLGYEVQRTDKIWFKQARWGPLGREIIAKAVQETADHFEKSISEVGQIAVVSATALGEVDLNYSDFGAAFLLENIDQKGNFSWTNISEGMR